MYGRAFQENGKVQRGLILSVAKNLRGHYEAEPYASPGCRNFYERYMKGEKINANWADKTDFEKAPLD